jgi:hypothetical protein
MPKSRYEFSGTPKGVFDHKRNRYLTDDEELRLRSKLGWKAGRNRKPAEEKVAHEREAKLDEGLTRAQLAELTGRSPETIKKSQQRARKARRGGH